MLRDDKPPAAWLVLVHQLPPRPTNLRVKTWRRLQDLGAVALKNSVYALPDTEQCREDFEWMKSEIQTMGGDATVFMADSIDAHANDEVRAAFRHAREADYAALAKDVAGLGRATSSTRRTSARPAAARRLRQLRERLDHLDAIAFVKPANRDRVAGAVSKLEALAARSGQARSTVPAGTLDRARFKKQVWVTRPRPGVDRMSSAWLIRRFIDPQARFAFAAQPPARGHAVPFDMFGVEFGHSAHGCTLETLIARFNLDSPTLHRIGRIVSDLDLKRNRYSEPEGAALGPLVEGLRQICANDRDLLERGIVMFEALYRGLSTSG